MDKNVALLNFTNVIINGPDGQIFWDKNYDLIFSSDISFDILNGAPGLQPTGGNAAMRLYIGNVLAVSNDKSQAGNFSFMES